MQVECINPLNPIVHFWLHHTAQCAEKIVSARYARRFCVNRKGGTGGGGCGYPLGDTHMVAARLGCQAPWLGPGGPILALAAWTGLENATLTL